MGKTSEVRSDGAGADTRSHGSSERGPSPGQEGGKLEGSKLEGSRKDRKRDAQKAAGPAARRQDEGGDQRIDAAEHLQQDFAKVRARAATDPVLAPRTFSAAWTTDVMEEEDEAEFVDAVADCLGAGFSLESALTGWDNGTLAADGAEEGSLFDEAGERDDEPPPAFTPRHTPTGGRRIVIT